MRTLSLILLTHATAAHIGAFAHLCKHVPLFTQIPIYATLPVISMGRTLLQDVYSSSPLAPSVIPKLALSESSYLYINSPTDDKPNILLQPPTSEEIASYFSLINPLKYSQPYQPLPSPFSPPLNGLTITAYNAGHTLGGTIWHIQHGMESVVYAVDWNQVRENVLSGAAWLGASGAGGAEVIEQLRKPTALICSAKGVEHTAAGRVRRDELLLDMIRSTIAKGGTVLIPTDTSARVLELAYVLDHAWRREPNNASDGGLKSARLYLANRNVGATMRYARSMLEWMDESVVREFEAQAASTGNTQHRRTETKQARNPQDQAGRNAEQAHGPFDFKHLKLLERKSQVERVLSNKIPKVILASDTSLAWGFSKEVLHRIATNPANLVILTERYDTKAPKSSGGNLGVSKLLWEWYVQRKDGVAIETGSSGQSLEQVYTDSRDLRFIEAHRVPLEGKELLIYQQYLATQRQLQTSMISGNVPALESSADAIDETSSTSSSSSEESDPERQGKALNISATLAQASRSKLGGGKEVTGVNLLLRQPGLFDYDVRGKKGRDAVFPYVTKRRRVDDFGEVIRPEEYLRAEERDEVDGQDMRDNSGGKQGALGQKRKWEDSSIHTANGRRSSLGTAKRRRVGDNARSNGLGSTTDQRNGYEEELLSTEESDNEAEELQLGPSKLAYRDSLVQANLRIAHVDFSGLHDQRSLSNVIPLIQPRKLVIVGGTQSETAWLAEECRNKLRSRLGSSERGILDDVFTPLVGETVGASMDTNAWTIKLSDALVRRLHWQDVKGLSVVTVMGQMAATPTVEDHQTEMLRRKRQKMLKEEETASDLGDGVATSNKASDVPPTLDVIPANQVAATRTVAQPLYVGDLRLAELRRILQSNGHTAEFRGEGTLLIDDLVAVRKSATGRVELEGGGLGLPEMVTRKQEGSFNAVRRWIYEGLALVAGG